MRLVAYYVSKALMLIYSHFGLESAAVSLAYTVVKLSF